MKNHQYVDEFSTYPIYLVSHYTALIALAGHLLFLILFSVLKIEPLIYINIFSCTIFVTAIFLNRLHFHKAILAMTMGEITLHAYAATFILGWSSGFHIYILTLIPLIFFYRFLRVSIRIILLLLLLSAYIGLNLGTRSLLILDAPYPGNIQTFELMNFTVAFLVFIILSASYSIAAMHLEQQLREKNQELEATSRIDPLTDLSNRRDILDKIEYERGKMLRNKINCCFILCDIDYFKKLNDTYGHDFGDFVLVEISRLFKKSLRSQDHICRWGGEEFLLVLPGIDITAGEVVAEKVRKIIREHSFNFQSVSEFVTLTFGVTQFDPEKNVDESIKIADQLLYQGKRNGRDRVESVKSDLKS